jgi:hypothetical protein
MQEFIKQVSNNVYVILVLPNAIRDRFIAELDKRLDLDIDALLDSPKLRLKLSPAELDKSLLELYDTMSESPGGDILRLIGGGGMIAMQNLYMRRHVERERWRKLKEGSAFLALDIFPSYVDDGDIDDARYEGTPTQLIRQSLRRNLPKITPRLKSKMKPVETKSEAPRMCCSSMASYSSSWLTQEWNGLRPPPKPFRRASSKFSILI